MMLKGDDARRVSWISIHQKVVALEKLVQDVIVHMDRVNRVDIQSAIPVTIRSVS